MQKICVYQQQLRREGISLKGKIVHCLLNNYVSMYSYVFYTFCSQFYFYYNFRGEGLYLLIFIFRNISNNFTKYLPSTQ